MKFIKRLSLGVLALAVLTALTFALANLSDDALDPRAEALMNESPRITEQGTKAFYYLMGIRAGDPDHAEATGEKLWKESIAQGNYEDQSNALMKNFRNDRWPRIDFAEKQEALSAQWKTRPEVREAVEKARTALAQYEKLMSYGEISTVNGNEFASASAMAPQMILYGHKIYRYHLGELVATGKWDEATRLLQQEAHTVHGLLTSNTLLMTMISAVILHNDATFLAEEIKLNPSLNVQRDLFADLALLDTNVIIADVLKTEMRYFHSAMPILKQRPFKSLIGEDAPWFTKYALARWLLLPNEAVNQYYAFMQENLAHRCPDFSLDTCYESMRWAHPQHPWEWVRNPTGKVLFRIFASNLGGRFQKLEIRKTQIDALIAELNPHAARK